MRHLRSFIQLVCLIGLTSVVGCGSSDSSAVLESDLPVDATGLLLSSEPAGAKGVIDLRKDSKNEDDVVLIGRIGGADQPWIEGRAAFVVIDPCVELCESEDGVCPCCVEEACAATALVKVVDEQGHLLKCDARKLFKVTENALVVVAGKAERDAAGNLTVLASGVYVRK